jgi:hypothetical protein
MDSAQSHAARLQQDCNSKASRISDQEEVAKASSRNMVAVQAHVQQLEEECARLKRMLDESVDMRIVAAKMTELETQARSSSNALAKQKSERNAAADKIRELTQQLEFAARQITQGEAHARQLLLVQRQLEESEKECEGLKRQRQVTKDARCVLVCDVSHCIAGHAQKHHKCSQQTRHRVALRLLDVKIVMSCVRRNVFTIPPASFRELSCDEAALSCSGGGLGEFLYMFAVCYFH